MSRVAKEMSREELEAAYDEAVIDNVRLRNAVVGWVSTAEKIAALMGRTWGNRSFHELAAEEIQKRDQRIKELEEKLQKVQAGAQEN